MVDAKGKEKKIMADKTTETPECINLLTAQAASIALEKVPPEVVHAGRRVIVDTLAVILGAAPDPQVKALSVRMAAASTDGCSTLPGTDLRADASWAALFSGTAGVWHEYDPGHRFSGGHPAVSCVAAAWAVAEREGASGKALLEAIIAGYECAARVGLGTTLRPGMTTHGSWPVVGAAAAAGRLRGYDAGKLKTTINVSTTLNLATSSRAAIDGATVRNVYAGFNAAAGVLAADLVGDGITGERDGIATVFGTLAGVYFDPEKALDGLGARWEIARGYHKRFPCARCLHPALDALNDALEGRDVSPEEVLRVEVETYGMAAAMSLTVPENGLAAKHSLPHAVAACLVRKRADLEAFSDEAARDPFLREIAKRVVVREDSALTARTPLERPATVAVFLKSGEVIRRSASLPRGEFDADPLSDAELTEKFRCLAAASLPEDRVLQALEQLWSIESVSNVRELMALLRR
jgi:2-methylcitrate dehydratase PrpD